jgi:hypothetical protein
MDKCPIVDRQALRFTPAWFFLPNKTGLRTLWLAEATPRAFAGPFPAALCATEAVGNRKRLS